MRESGSSKTIHNQLPRVSCRSSLASSISVIALSQVVPISDLSTATKKGAPLQWTDSRAALQPSSQSKRPWIMHPFSSTPTPIPPPATWQMPQMWQLVQCCSNSSDQSNCLLWSLCRHIGAQQWVLKLVGRLLGWFNCLTPLSIDEGGAELCKHHYTLCRRHFYFGTKQLHTQ